MESATDLRIFAAHRFYESGLGRFLPDERRFIFDIGMLGAIFESAQELKRNDALLNSVADWTETMQWYGLGVQLGYFDKRQTLETPDIVFNVALSEAAESWALPFRHIALQFADKEFMPAEIDELPSDDPTALAVFQSAMIASEQFRDPFVRSLTGYLNASEALRPIDVVEAQQVFDALEYKGRMLPRRARNLPAFLVAGMLRLIDAMNAMEAIFPAEIAATKEHPVRTVIGRRVMQLLSWRVDQWKQDKAERLNILLNMLWDCCARESQRYVTDFRIDFAEADMDFREKLSAWHTWTQVNGRSYMTNTSSSEDPPARRNRTSEAYGAAEAESE
jgi:hypothetical protein